MDVEYQQMWYQQMWHLGLQGLFTGWGGGGGGGGGAQGVVDMNR